MAAAVVSEIDMDLRKSLLKVAIGIAMLIVIGSFYAGRETPEPITPHVYLVEVLEPATIDDLRGLLSDYKVRIKRTQPPQEGQYLVEVVAAGDIKEVETRLDNMIGIQVVERTEGYKN